MTFNNTKFLAAFKKHFGDDPFKDDSCKGVNRTVMHKIRNEGNPSRDNFAKICKAMGTKMESFFTSK